MVVEKSEKCSIAEFPRNYEIGRNFDEFARIAATNDWRQYGTPNLEVITSLRYTQIEVSLSFHETFPVIVRFGQLCVCVCARLYCTQYKLYWKRSKCTRIAVGVA